MKNKSIFHKLWFPIFGFILISLTAGCSQLTNEPDFSDEPTTDKAAFEVLSEQDSSVYSFYANYNEEDAMVYAFGNVNPNFYPARVGHRVRLVGRNMETNIVGDTAYATLTLTFEGKLFVAVSYDSVSTQEDSIIVKDFSSQIKRNLIFVRVGNSPRPRLNWRLAATSLPIGGTLASGTFTNNIKIEKMTLTFANNQTIEINSPLEYYFWFGAGGNRMPLPSIAKGQEINIKAEVYSAYGTIDFVTVTYGADRFGNNRKKVRLSLVSSVQVGDGYMKVYEANLRVNQIAGHFHAVLNAMPHQVIFDRNAAVEASSWGMPYHVRK